MDYERGYAGKSCLLAEATAGRRPAFVLIVMGIQSNYLSYQVAEGLAPAVNQAYEEELPRRKAYLFCKRSVDLVFSLLVIICLLSWLLPIMALLIRLDSRGPAFFLQKRVGRHGRLFTCYKLRTMVPNKEADEMAASEYDRRITRLGWLLRKTNMDELPQFINVFFGTMSIVGPRPHMVMDYRHFSSVVPGYGFRNLLRPGITGLAQVKGFHGPVKEIGKITGRYQWDAFYICHAGLLMDWRIIRRTAANFFLNAGQYIFTRIYGNKNTEPFVGARAPGDKDLYQ